MDISWGYYCRTCSRRSNLWPNDPSHLRQLAQAARELLAGGDVVIRSNHLRPLAYLRRHLGHEVEIVSETLLVTGPEDDEEPEPVRFAV